MSFEGYHEKLCRNGHYWTADVYVDRPACPRCGEPAAWEHTVDQTNGQIEDAPETQPYPLETAGAEDEWHRDHYGNEYAVLVPLYRIPPND